MLPDIYPLAGSMTKCPVKQRRLSTRWALAPVLVLECILHTWNYVWRPQSSSVCSKVLVSRPRRRRSVWRWSTFSQERPRGINVRLCWAEPDGAAGSSTMNLLISTPQIVSFIRLLQSLNVNAFFPFHGYPLRALSLVCSQEHPVKTSEVFKT
jgi:hypothetical protein